ncbi:hypothetical protein EJB05_01552, partial [Eragrostis curvula]
MSLALIHLLQPRPPSSPMILVVVHRRGNQSPGSAGTPARRAASLLPPPQQQGLQPDVLPPASPRRPCSRNRTLLLVVKEMRGFSTVFHSSLCGTAR